MMNMTKEEAELELKLQIMSVNEADAEKTMIRAISAGIPVEISTRLEALWSATLQIGGEVWKIGKLIVKRIMDFFDQNPGMTIGIAIGAVVAMFVASIPILGPLLAPFTTPLLVLFGIKEGKAVDGRVDQGMLTAAIDAAKVFFRLIVDIVLIITGRAPLNAN